MIMIWYFISFTLFKPYWDDGGVKTKGSLQYGAAQMWAEFRIQQDSNLEPRNPK